MDSLDSATSPPPPLPYSDQSPSQKRKRSPSPSHASRPTPPPPAKVPKTSHSSHLHINYLVRQYADILPLITSEDTLPALLSLISDYDGVLQRHESMAGNLGARPLGPMLISRFERLFDGPPQVLKTHGKEGTQISWLDVVEFARNKPEQFNLEKMRDGVRVCQFYTKQCRVEISEEDFELLSSGVPQKMIPPQPIGEDEEKELGTLEILEKNVGGVVQLADQVSARARQLNHRLKMRRGAIVQRREVEAAERREEEGGGRSPGASKGHVNGEQRSSASPTSGFTAVNSKPAALSNGQSSRYENGSPRPSTTTTNGGSSHHGASAATRAELLSKFRTSSDRDRETQLDSPDPSRLTGLHYPSSSTRPSFSQKSKSRPSTTDDLSYPNNLLAASQQPVPIPQTPSTLLPPSSFTNNKPAPATDPRAEDSGPYKADMMLRMEQLNRADRVQPPCDRCRRLHMDCLKNLTACIGCTKKHAKCSWKDVTEAELKEFPFVARGAGGTGGSGNGSAGGRSGSEGPGGGEGEKGKKRGGRDWSAEARVSGEVRDEELLGEESDEEMGDAPPAAAVAADRSVEGAVMNGEVQAPASPSNGAAPSPTVNGQIAIVNGNPAAPVIPAVSTLDDAKPVAYDQAQPTSLVEVAAEVNDPTAPAATVTNGNVNGNVNGALKVYTAGHGSVHSPTETEEVDEGAGGVDDNGVENGKGKVGVEDNRRSRSGSAMRWDEESGRMRLE